MCLRTSSLIVFRNTYVMMIPGKWIIRNDDSYTIDYAIKLRTSSSRLDETALASKIIVRGFEDNQLTHKQ